MKPKLRFPGFGEDWEEKKLGEISDIVKSYSISRDKEVETSSLEYVHYGDIHRYLANGNTVITKDRKLPFIQEDEYELLQTGDVVVADASEDYQGIANPLILLDIENRKIVSGLHTIAFRPMNCLDSLFFYYYLFTSRFKHYGYRVGTGLKVFGISKTNLQKHQLCIPSLPEQEKIGEFLSLLDQRIEKQEEKIELMKKRKKGWMQKVFHQEIRFKDENGNDYPDWEEKKLGEVLNYEQPTRYIVNNAEYNDEYTTPVLTANKSFILGYTNDKDGIYDGECIIFDDFTLESKYVNFPFKVKSSAIKILTSKIDDIYFLSQLLQNTSFISEGHARHYISIVQNKEVEIPSLPEQEKIANFLSVQDELIEKEEEKLNLLKEQKKGLLQQMFV